MQLFPPALHDPHDLPARLCSNWGMQCFSRAVTWVDDSDVSSSSSSNQRLACAWQKHQQAVDTCPIA